MGTIRSHIPRAMLLHQLPPPSGVPSVIHATNKPRKQHLQCKPMPSFRHRGPDFLGSTCRRRASPKRLVFRSQRSGEQRQHQSARKGGCPATRATLTHCRHRHSCGMPFALYDSNHYCMMPPLTTAGCAELEEISLTPCDDVQTHARFA